MLQKSQDEKRVFVPRVTQSKMTSEKKRNYGNKLPECKLDATEFDKEIHSVLVSQLMEVSKYFKPGALNNIKHEINLSIHLLIFYYSVIKKNATFGQELLKLQYKDLLSKNQLVLYAFINFVLPYLNSKCENNFSSASTQPTLVVSLFQKAEVCVKIVGFVNYFLFIRDGKYPTIIDRLLSLKYSSVNKINPNVGYNYMTRELLWHGFLELLMHILPLINYKAIKRKTTNFFLSKSKIGNFKNLIYDCETKCVICDDFPNLPCQISKYCPHVTCYYCLKSNVLGDEKFMCPLCGETNTAIENLMFLTG